MRSARQSKTRFGCRNGTEKAATESGTYLKDSAFGVYLEAVHRAQVAVCLKREPKTRIRPSNIGRGGTNTLLRRNLRRFHELETIQKKLDCTSDKPFVVREKIHP